MLFENEFRNPKDAGAVLSLIRDAAPKDEKIRIMEICGTHTMAIARSGLKSVLPDTIELLSGPGCPVCVTPAGVIDMILKLTEDPSVLITSYGDLLRVPGSKRGDSLLARSSAGAAVEPVYSPVDALDIARSHPELEVVFLGVGFETTAPGTAACIMEAANDGIDNFSVICMLKKTAPALCALTEAPDFAVNGFICPGHVAAITGSDAFSFLPEKYGLPAVVAGFEAADLLTAVLSLTRMITKNEPDILNEYTRLVRPHGNPAALRLMDTVFAPASSEWRGLGLIEDSGYAIRDEFSRFDAVRKFSLSPSDVTDIPGCSCAEIIRGVMRPHECPLFGTTCTPEDPVGPCMVSGEGACAAAYQYGRF